MWFWDILGNVIGYGLILILTFMVLRITLPFVAAGAVGFHMVVDNFATALNGSNIFQMFCGFFIACMKLLIGVAITLMATMTFLLKIAPEASPAAALLLWALSAAVVLSAWWHATHD